MKSCKKVLGFLLIILFITHSPELKPAGLPSKIVNQVKAGKVSPWEMLSVTSALMPSQSIKLFEGFSISLPKITDGPVKLSDYAGTFVYTDNYYITGDVQFKDASGIDRTVIGELFTGVEEKTKERYWSFTIRLPENWKLSDMFKIDAVKFPDDFKLPKSEFTLSSFPEYLDTRSGITYKKGLTFTSDVGLTGPTTDLNVFLTKLRSSSAGSYKTSGLKFVGRIGSTLQDLAFGIIIPAGIKIDLAKGNPNKPFVKEITLGEMSAGIIASPFALTFQAGAKLDFSDPKQGAITIKSSFDINPTGFALSGEVSGSLKVTDWLTIEDIGLTVGVGYDSPLLVNNLAIKGVFDFGGKTKVSVIGGVTLPDVDTGTAGNVAFIGNVTNLDFADIVALVGKMSGDKNIKATGLPDMKLDKFDIYIVPVDAKLFGVQYYAGFKVNVQNLSLFGQKASFMFEAKEATKSMEGSGTMQLDIAGLKFDTNADLLLSAEKPELNRFSFNTALNIPKFKFIGSIGGAFGKVKPNPTTGKLEIIKTGEIAALDDGALFNGELKIANTFDADVDVQVDFTQSRYSRMDYNLTSSIGKQAKIELDKAVKNLKAQASKDLAQFTNELKDLTNTLAKAKGDFDSDAQKEKTRVEALIKKLIADIKALDKKCKAEPWYKAGLGKPCLDKTGKDFELAGLQAYYQGLLKPGSSVVSGTLGVVKDVTKKIEETKVLQKIAQGMVDAGATVLTAIGAGINAFEIKQATGWFYFNQIEGEGSGKLAAPYIQTLIIRVGNKTVQFKDVVLSVDNIGKMFSQLAEGIVSWAKDALVPSK